jgi:methionyl-tRNA formyltransferase
MKETGAQLLVRTIKGLQEGTLQETPQSQMEGKEGALRHAPKIFTDTCRIDWNNTVEEVHNLVRGLSPFPGAFTTFNGKTLKIYRSEKEAGAPGKNTGEMDTDGKTYFKFACTDGWLLVKELQLEGKKRMPAEDFLRGFRMP